jgi:acyl carrier protein
VPSEEREVLLERLLDYVRQDLLGGEEMDGPVDGLTTTSPLLEWGVLNSMNTTRLLVFLRQEFNVAVPPVHITGRHFKDLDSIADLVLTLTPN